MPSSADLKYLVRRWFDEVWNQGRQDTIDALLTSDSIVHGLSDASGQPVHGPAGFRTFYDRFRSAFSDIHIAIDDMLAEGDKVCARFTFEAIHSGADLGPAPTGRRIRITGLCISRWRDGRIAEAWNEFDAAGMMAQMS
jgi:steroid delta-isomerase-like uncharacterized protein